MTVADLSVCNSQVIKMIPKMEEKKTLLNIFKSVEGIMIDLYKLDKDQTIKFMQKMSVLFYLRNNERSLADDSMLFDDMMGLLKFTASALENVFKMDLNKKQDFSLGVPPEKKRKLQKPLNSVENKENEGFATNSRDLSVLPSSAGPQSEKTDSRKSSEKVKPLELKLHQVLNFVKNKVKEGLASNSRALSILPSQPTSTDPQSKKSVKRKLSDIVTPLESKKRNGVINLEHRHSSKTKPIIEKDLRFLPSLDVESPMKSARTLSCLFRGCISLVPESRASASDDIDMALRTVGSYGKILYIRNHWSQSGSLNRPITQLSGVLVAYERAEDSQAALKGLLVRRFPRVIPINVPDHLLLVGRLENQLPAATPDSPGSSILITGLNSLACRVQVFQQLNLYGRVLSSQWKVINEQNTCNVTYRYVVEAVAAAMALNGRRIARNTLRATVKINRREMSLHMLVRGHTC